MSYNILDASALKKAFLAGAASLEEKKEWINELNVFPVPDGDTGTNMTMTIMSAVKEVSEVSDENIPDICKAISSGSLRGARGNSGVILSQLLRGFTNVLKEYDSADTIVLAAAMEKAVETAYKAVMKPKEGTILTVARSMSDKAMSIASEVEDIESFMKEVIDEGEKTLARTPQMLPVLKQAGVVDSGGQGLMQIMRGVYAYITGTEPDYSRFERPSMDRSLHSQFQFADIEHIDTADIKFGYCTEFIVNLEHKIDDKDVDDFKSYLESIGDSIVCVADDELIKIHVHTNDPGLAIQKALSYGSLSRMKIDNMREEHKERLIKNSNKLSKENEIPKKNEAVKTPLKDYGFISVSAGEGLSEIFKGIGADYIIEGGQTMNPSTQDMLDAIDMVTAKDIFILPNNRNIILAAEQAANMSKDKKVHVIPTKTIPQGISALVAFMPESSIEENTENMIQELSCVKSLQLTYAVRDTLIDGINIHEGDIMAIGDRGIVYAGKDIESTLIESVKRLVDEKTEIISLFYGADVNEENAKKVAQDIEKLFPDIEVELDNGGQPVYYYIISIE